MLRYHPHNVNWCLVFVAGLAECSTSCGHLQTSPAFTHQQRLKYPPCKAERATSQNWLPPTTTPSNLIDTHTHIPFATRDLYVKD